MSDSFQKAIDDYRVNRGLYETLTEKVVSLLKEIMDLEGMDYSNISGRTKSLGSYIRKARKEKYSDPQSEIFDMSGIRIILYTNSGVKKARKLVEKYFSLHPEHTVDKSVELGVDRMGYRSLHCVGKFDKKRAELPEYSSFRDTYFEIQIRTILQHAWAEFEHDRNYKFSGVLPDIIKRRLSIIAGTLELTDNEFDKISEEIDNYSKEVSEKTEKGILNMEITSISLLDYLNNKFHELIKKDFLKAELNDGEDRIKEMKLMGINTIDNLDNNIPKDFIVRISVILKTLLDIDEDYYYNFDAVLFDILVIKDHKKYLTDITPFSITLLQEQEIKFYKSYGVDIKYFSE
ncbi:MAG: hypothetical protein NWE88_02085 [Candidatus Bathyarchaeota archaeon]|nr:hypothetical protein [Candidatus Bathyarchaeota archaeon]